MLSIDLLSGNYLDVLADVSVSANYTNNDDIAAVVTLAESSLRIGSGIDVFVDGVFWESEIIAVKWNRFQYKFVDSESGGWVMRGDFLKTWRFPVRVQDDVRKTLLMAEAFAA